MQSLFLINYIKDNLIFDFNEEDKNAAINDNDNASGDILIPRTVKNKSQDYIK